jgi:hypothetical protein
MSLASSTGSITFMAACTALSRSPVMLYRRKLRDSARRSNSAVTVSSSLGSFFGAVFVAVLGRFTRLWAGRELGRRFVRRTGPVPRYPGGCDGGVPESGASGTQNRGVMTHEREAAGLAGGFARVGSGSIDVTFLLRIVFSAPMLPLSCLVVSDVQVTWRVTNTP